MRCVPNKVTFVMHEVDAGFSAVDAIKIATLVVVRGNPMSTIRDIENVDVVFKDAIGHDAKRLVESVTCQVGIR
jgi:hypothetical protein